MPPTSHRRSAAFGAALVAGLLAVTVSVVSRQTAAAPPSRPDLWKKVKEAEDKGLPKTAIAELEPIIESAIKDKAYPEAIRAVAKKVALEATIQGNKPEEKIARLKAEIAKAPKEMTPVLDAVLAHWHWQFFQENRWRFVQRSQTTVKPGDDIATWDLKRVFAEVDALFAKALANEKELQATPVANYEALLAKGTIPDSYRPTLWDFLVFDAIGFYASAEQAGAKPEDAFEIDAAGPVFAPRDEFLKWEPKTADPSAAKFKAIKLFQQVLAFHRADGDPSAALDADLSRLRFAYQASVGEAKLARYKAALQEFADTHKGHELSATARFRLASVLDAENRKVEAKKVAAAAVTAYPDSHGGKQAHNLILAIEAKDVSVVTERVLADPLPPIRVQYRNITEVHFRAYKADWAARLVRKPDGWHRPEHLTDDEPKAMLAGKPDLTWSATLPATDDHMSRTEDTPAPKELRGGFYFVFASPDPEFRDKKEPIFATDLWVSDLALVLRNAQGDLPAGGIVLHAKTGEPVAGAKVKTWVRNPKGGVVPAEDAVTDKAGQFKSPAKGDERALYLVSHDGRELGAASEQHVWGHTDRDREHVRVVMFTDRSIYRPGQTIRFKGIGVKVHQSQDNYDAVPKTDLTVRFRDPNGKEVSKVDVTTNEYGSFSGSFVAPRDRLTGQMQIHVNSANRHAHGDTLVQVEEYKRPQFQVEVNAPTDAVKLGEKVTVIGKATAYTGSAVGGANVQYRVTRQVRYPSWFHDDSWHRPMPRTPAQEIAHGGTVTDPDGTFAVTFDAAPDKSVPEKDEPTFTYQVTADVTDTTGETRSADRTVRLGYASLAATVSQAEWQTPEKPVTFTVSTTNLDGQPLKAVGLVKVFALKQPDAVKRPDLIREESGSYPRRWRGGKVTDPKPDPADIRSWESGDLVASLQFDTTDKGRVEVPVKLPAGAFRVVVETADKDRKPVTAKGLVKVVDPAAKALAVRVPSLFEAPKWSLEPGEEFQALWGTGYPTGRAYVEVVHRGKTLQAYWTDADRTQAVVKQKVTEGMRGGFTVCVTSVRENRLYAETRQVDVPWSNKNLTVKWEHFVSKLEPGAKEKWTAVVTGPDAKKAVAEMVATMYDASLDQYAPHHWAGGFGVFRHEHWSRYATFENRSKVFSHAGGQWEPKWKTIDPLTYRAFPQDVIRHFRGYEFGPGGGGPWESQAKGDMGYAGEMRLSDYTAVDALEEAALSANVAGGTGEVVRIKKESQFISSVERKPSPSQPKLDAVAARANLNETAFFFPHLVSDADGVVKLEFTMPEAVTKWKFLGFVHDKTLRSGTLTGETVTAKDLMVQPNAPRFLREGDELEFTVKVSNQSDAPQKGSARLTLSDARTGQPVDPALGNATPDQAFDVPAKQSKTLSWRLTVPSGQGPLIYKAVAATDKLSDGEEGVLPVLSRRILVTESLPLPIRGQQNRTFEFKKLLDSGKSDTLKHQSVTVQMASNPSWYAIMALPYLMEFPHECSEQTFNRLYANAVARHIANSDKKIRGIFDQWKNQPGVLDSPLEKNQDLKSVLLDETPWVRQATAESQARKNVGILFDANRLDDETGRLTAKLADMQQADGAWPWFPGGPPSDYITLYIATGYGRMRHLGVKVDAAPGVKALTRLDAWADRMYRDILKHSKNTDDNHLTETIALWLYGRSFFLDDKAVPNNHREAVTYWVGQAKTHWLKLANRQSQAHMAVALKRFGVKDVPTDIMKSIKERSVSEEELGMFWRELELSYSWFRAPIETQAMMIEAFDEVMGDKQAVEDCKVWLLKQKQTQDWKTTKATADAVYALILRGDSQLRSDAVVEVTVGGEKVQPEKVEAGTGFYEHKFLKTEIRPDMGKVEVKKTDAGVAWGGIHWQYLEDVAKVTPHEGTPLKLEKKVFKRTPTKAGPVLEPVTGTVLVGDELVVRIVLRADRDMEYVHMKDHRGSGTEPVNVLSRYKYRDGLGYYEATRDTATNFYIDYLPKGNYVFEYPVRVVHKGKYPTGLASIQCMYAPEFNSHSESVTLEAK